MTGRELLDLAIDRDSDLPLATQLAWKLQTLIATGRLAPGERLPGVRDLAESAGVNVNTVRAVYGRLEEAGLISSQHGRGTFVTADAPSHAQLGEIAGEAAERARRAGLDPRDVAAALFVDVADPVAAEESDPTPASKPADDRERRRGLRAEIAAAERELSYLEGATSEPLPARPDVSGRILDTGELEAVRDRLIERLELRRREAEEARRRLRDRRREEQEPAEAARPAGRRVWGHAGVSTGKLAPAAVVWTSGS